MVLARKGGAAILIISWRVPGHAHVCTCLLHLLNECVGGGAGCTDVVNQQNPLAVEVVSVYLNVLCKQSVPLGRAAHLVVLLADMHFLTLADNLDMLEAVDSLALGAHCGRKTLVPALVGLLTARPSGRLQGKNWQGCTR